MGKRNPSNIITVRVGGVDGHVVKVNGREAWALQCLLLAAEKGCTPITTPGPRWSAYVHDLRAAGINIETVHEPHGPPFVGTHARYILRSPVEVLQRTEGGRQTYPLPIDNRPPAQILDEAGALK
jgi:hypothetical protein